MKLMTITDVVRELIGPVTATGEHSVDDRRLKNLKELIELVDDLLGDIHEASRAKSRQEASMKKIGETADEFLQKLREPVI